MASSEPAGAASENRFGKYQLLRRLASGGMGEVFLAKQLGPVGFEKLMVIKTMLAQHSEKQSYVEMFFSEARLAALLNHSNIVQIFDMGEVDEHLYIAMEYVHGRSLRELVDACTAQGKQVPCAAIIDIGMQLCAGLSYAHNMTDPTGEPLNIVHRDINPHNALISYHGEAKIIDFGIAKSTINTHKTETGTIKGKYLYMSPEQSAAEPLDRRSDIFALGIVFYEMATGANPFQHNNIVQALEAIQRKDPPRLELKRPDVAPIANIIHKMLAKEPDDRFADCADIRAALGKVQLSGQVEGGSGALKTLMQQVFSQQMAMDKQMLQEASSWAKDAPARKAPPQRSNSGTGTTPPPRTPPAVSRMADPGPPEDALEEEQEEQEEQDSEEEGLEGGSDDAPEDDGAFDGDSPTIAVPAHALPVPAKPAPQPAKTPAPAAPPPVKPPPPAQPSAYQATEKVQRRARRSPVGALVAGGAVCAALLGVGWAVLVKPKGNTATVPPVTPPKPSGPAGEPTPVPTPAPTPVPAVVEPVTPVEPTKPTPRPTPKEDPKRRPEPEATPAPVAVEPTPEPTPKPEEPKPAPKTFGKLTVRAGNGVPVSLGKDSGTGTTVLELSQPQGNVRIGGPASGFSVTLRYEVERGGVSFSVDSDPWGIVQAGGVGLGKTPQRDVAKGKTTASIILKSPKVPEPMEISWAYKASGSK